MRSDRADTQQHVVSRVCLLVGRERSATAGLNLPCVRLHLIASLQEKGRIFREAFISKLSLLLRGTVAAPPERFGETLADEHIRGGAFVGPDNKPVVVHEHLPNGEALMCCVCVCALAGGARRMSAPACPACNAALPGRRPGPLVCGVGHRCPALPGPCCTHPRVTPSCLHPACSAHAAVWWRAVPPCHGRVPGR